MAELDHIHILSQTIHYVNNIIEINFLWNVRNWNVQNLRENVVIVW